MSEVKLSTEDARLLLAESRAKIDSLDRKLVDLLNERTRFVADIGRAKSTVASINRSPYPRPRADGLTAILAIS